MERSLNNTFKAGSGFSPSGATGSTDRQYSVGWTESAKITLLPHGLHTAT